MAPLGSPALDMALVMALWDRREENMGCRELLQDTLVGRGERGPDTTVRCVPRDTHSLAEIWKTNWKQVTAKQQHLCFHSHHLGLQRNQGFAPL